MYRDKGLLWVKQILTMAQSREDGRIRFDNVAVEQPLFRDKAETAGILCWFLNRNKQSQQCDGIGSRYCTQTNTMKLRQSTEFTTEKEAIISLFTMQWNTVLRGALLALLGFTFHQISSKPMIYKI